MVLVICEPAVDQSLVPTLALPALLTWDWISKRPPSQAFSANAWQRAQFGAPPEQSRAKVSADTASMDLVEAQPASVVAARAIAAKAATIV